MPKLDGFYNSKRVLLTGHTGFKGSWMAAFLHEIGAEVYGYSLDPRDSNDLFHIAAVSEKVHDGRGDILDLSRIKDVIESFRPEIVFHFAAQPLVIESYKRPRYTWEVNVMGTVNLLDCLKDSNTVRSIVIITTDKVYKNIENVDGYKEEEKLGGFDPYSSSKAAVEILVESMYNSFFKPKNIGLATSRSGNVIGGGDWAENRLIPDYYRALHNKTPFELRNPSAVRPWQHVLDVLYGYSVLGMKLFHDGIGFSKAWNFGPDENNITTKEIIDKLNETNNLEVTVLETKYSDKHETNTLRLNSSIANEQLGWRNLLSLEKSLILVNYFYLNYFITNVQKLMNKQIKEYIKLIDSHNIK